MRIAKNIHMAIPNLYLSIWKMEGRKLHIFVQLWICIKGAVLLRISTFRGLFTSTEGAL